MSVAASVGVCVSVEVFANLWVRDGLLSVLCGIECADEQVHKILGSWS